MTKLAKLIVAAMGARATETDIEYRYSRGVGPLPTPTRDS